MMYKSVGILIVFQLIFCAGRDQDHLNVYAKNPKVGESRAVLEDKDYWLNDAEQELQTQIAKTINTNQAKNVILFIGDGTSLGTLTGTRLFKGYSSNLYEREVLEFEKFPYTGFIKTYNTDMMTTDSAASSTAYQTGVKANQGTLGVDANVAKNDCAASKNTSNHAQSVLRDFQIAGKSTGIVTNTRVTHASPAGSYAHSSSRHWESDGDMIEEGQDPSDCSDIARQLVEGVTGSNINVILGGGRRVFYPNTSADIETDGNDFGDRQDGRNLVNEWLIGHTNAQYVWNADDLDSVDAASIDNLLGLFDKSHMEYVDKVTAGDQDPTLEQMVEKAIEILQKNTNGFYLFVEGGLIDKAHHENMGRTALKEGLEIEKAIAKAASMTSELDTLIVFSADHAQPYCLNGYQIRQGDVTGYSNDESYYEYEPSDTFPVFIQSYGNGPGYRDQKDNLRPDPTTENWLETDFVYPSAAPGAADDGESRHSPEDVWVYARGPWSHLFTGIHENSYIPRAFRHAACVGYPTTNACSP